MEILVGSARLSLEVGVSLGLLQVIVGQYAGKSLLLPRLPPRINEVLPVSAGSEALLVLNGWGLQWCSYSPPY